MSRFAKLVAATASATLVMVAIGGLVRATGSGLGCGAEWPRCHGRIVPPSTAPSWIEHSHRLWALVVIALVVATAVEARRSRQPKALRRPAYALVPLVLSQALLGAVVVWLRLQPISVAAHLGIALSILGLTVVLLRRAFPDPAAPSLGPRLARVTAVAAFAQLLLGSLVTGAGAGLSYATFPTFNGDVMPRPADVQQYLHAGHRFGAVVVTALVAALVWHERKQTGSAAWQRGPVAAAAALVVVQVGLGALAVLTRLAVGVVVAHLVVGALLWSALVAAAVSPAHAPPRQRANARVPEMAAS